MAGGATSFVSASNSCKYLIPEWFERIHEDYEREEHSIKLLDVDGRNAVWNMCQQLGVGTETVAPTACLILERYIHAMARKAIADCRRRGSVEEEVGAFHLRAICDRLPLLLAAAVQLVAKMSSSAHHITALKVQRCLKKKGLKYTLSQVTQAEFDVFQAVEFRLPLWPSLETATLLSREAGLPLALLPKVARVLELAELRRPELDHEAAGSAGLSGSREIGTMALCAGAVAAAARLDGSGCDPIPALASFAKSPEAFIRLVADLIVAMALRQESDDDSSSSSSSDD